MNRLMRAEWYRIWHSGNIRVYVVLAALLFAVFPVFGSLGMMKEPLITHIMAGAEMMPFLILMLVSPMVALAVGILYSKGKLGYYEVMAGNKIPAVIFSKLLTDGVFFTILVTVSLTLFYIIMGCKNGLGGYDHVAERYLLLTLIITRVVLTGILITLCFRSLAASVVAYLRFSVVDIILFELLAWLVSEVFGGSEKLVENLRLMAVMYQISYVFLMEPNQQIILQVVLGLLVEFILWYSFCYIGMKKRMY